KAEGRQRLLHAVLQQLERRIGGDAGPQDLRATVIGKHSESGDLQTQRSWLGAVAGGALQCRPQLGLARVVDVAQEFEAQMNVLGSYPLHGACIATLPPRHERVPQLLPEPLGKTQRAAGSTR